MLNSIAASLFELVELIYKYIYQLNQLLLTSEAAMPSSYCH